MLSHAPSADAARTRVMCVLVEYSDTGGRYVPPLLLPASLSPLSPIEAAPNNNEQGHLSLTLAANHIPCPSTSSTCHSHPMAAGMSGTLLGIRAHRAAMLHHWPASPAADSGPPPHRAALHPPRQQTPRSVTILPSMPLQCADAPPAVLTPQNEVPAPSGRAAPLVAGRHRRARRKPTDPNDTMLAVASDSRWKAHFGGSQARGVTPVVGLHCERPFCIHHCSIIYSVQHDRERGMPAQYETRSRRVVTNARWPRVAHVRAWPVLLVRRAPLPFQSAPLEPRSQPLLHHAITLRQHGQYRSALDTVSAVV